jgi:hypothetical protein
MLPKFDDHPINTNTVPTQALKLSTDNKELMALHETFGHYNIRAICEALNIKLPDSFKCHHCLESKTNRNSTKSHNSTEHDVLDVVEMDLQFINIVGLDGTTVNIKAVDVATGFVVMQTLPDKSASSTFAFLSKYKRRIEKHTGRNIKNIRTDDGTEFKREFQEQLISEGITHQIGHPYDHHYPPHVKRAHQTITKIAMTMLNPSNLPEYYYTEAMKTAVYI